MANIHILPTEVLTLIFQQLLPGQTPEASQVARSPNRAIFPLNVASVCMLWHKILLSHRRFWKQTVIDVATNPTPFLKVFALLNGYNDGQVMTFDVVVFSSLKGAACPLIQNIGDVERLRTEVVFKKLRESGAIRFCQSVTFDLVYQASLPCAATIMTQCLPYLSELSLLSEIDQEDIEEERTIEIDRNALSYSVGRINAFPRLKKLSLTCYCFLQICLLGRDWLMNFRTSQKVVLSINKFLFFLPVFAPWETSLPFFLDSLGVVSGAFDEINLSDLCLDYYPTKNDPRVYELHMNKLTMDTVTSNFITAFFYNTCIMDVVTLTFKNCYIPDLGRDIPGYDILGTSLELIDIPKPSMDRYDSLYDSIYHAVSAFPSTNLYLSNCHNFYYQDFFRWLRGYPGLGVERPLLRNLVISGHSFGVEDIMLLVEPYEVLKRDGYFAELSLVHLILDSPPCDRFTSRISEHNNGGNLIRVIYTVSREGVDAGEAGQQIRLSEST